MFTTFVSKISGKVTQKINPSIEKWGVNFKHNITKP